ncbi:MBL fold metallo-hydrolase [Clostridium polynesiense]|uniref:MBL fold metallo-hydrolase n=1 Tax=Clostridium polynesiense TaxID=1325933 RepID=UPI00058DA25E|nr:MBL fold metallo-hydrolase [Clostridium polynesiense]
MFIKRMPAGIYAANCYIITDENTKDALVIDPGGDEDDIIDYINEKGLKVQAVLVTHGHFDHVGAVRVLAEKYDVKIYINEKDHRLMEKGAGAFGDISGSDIIYIGDNEVIKFGSIEIKAIETPGHSPGSMSYLVKDDLFTGDALFQMSIGRTDLEGGDFDTLISSIVEKLIILGDHINVHPGHGMSSTIQQERLYNPYLN